jgi:MarR family transcriptional regulator, lower aerobic nicotinate degradation pathway regulator
LPADTPPRADPDTPPTRGAESYRLEDQIGFKLRLASQRHIEIFSRRLPEVTPTQFAVLAKLRETGQISQNQLGRSVGMDAATTKGVVDRLRRKGLVQSAPSGTDMRRLDISLTPEGESFALDAVATARAISEETLARLTRREAARLLSLLDKL